MGSVFSSRAYTRMMPSPATVRYYAEKSDRLLVIDSWKGFGIEVIRQVISCQSGTNVTETEIIFSPYVMSIAAYISIISMLYMFGFSRV